MNCNICKGIGFYVTYSYVGGGFKKYECTCLKGKISFFEWIKNLFWKVSNPIVEVKRNDGRKRED